MKQIRYLSILILAFALMAGSVGSAFALSLSNGQAAGLVLGEPDFATSSCQVTQAGMCGPTSVAVDPTTGKVFVSDYWNNRVLRYASVLALTNGSAAQAVLGQPDFTSNTHATTQNGMYQPWGVTVDSTGRLWVADLENSRVLRFDNASAKASGANADGVLGQPNFTSSTVAATQSGMDNPWGVVVDSAGRLWVGDESNNRVLRFDSAASKANGANANAVLGQSNFTNHASATSQSRMSDPGPMVLDSSGTLWLVDLGNNRVLRFNTAASKANGANADGVLGQPNFTSSTAKTTQSGMHTPEGIALDSSGKLWVSDDKNYRILGFANAASLANGANASVVLGQTNFTSSTHATTASGLYAPTGLFYDPASDVLWAADFANNRVLKYGVTKTKPASKVLGEPNFTTSSCQVTQAGMCGPTSVAVDPTTGKVFVSDYWNNRVLRYASASALSNGSAAQAVLGQPDFTSNTHATTRNGMYQPWGVTVDSTGRLWVADFGNSRVLRFDNASAKASDANADGVLGQPNFTSSAAAATQSGMDNPWGVVVDSAGRLWVGDESNNRVLRFDSAASKANGAKANAVLGQTNFTNHASAASQSRMYNPGPMVLDSSGRLWVVDFGNNRVLRFNTAASKANGANADGVLGQPNFTSSTARTTQGGMSAPEGIALDSSGKLWVSDNANYRILGFTNAASLANGSKASSMLGQLYYGASLCLTTPSGLCYPTGIFYDHAAGVLWVADFDNNRVVMYNHP